MVKVAVWDTDENYLRKEKRLVDQYMRVHGYQYCIESPASEVDLMIIGDAYRIIFVTACQGVHAIMFIVFSNLPSFPMTSILSLCFDLLFQQTIYVFLYRQNFLQ